MFKFSTISQVLLKITLIVSVSQLIILLLIGNIPHSMSGETVDFEHLAYLALLNMVLLVVITTPAIYYWVIVPFVTARDAAISHAKRLAYYDQLTKLGNRRLIYQNLEKIKARCARRNVFGAVLLIDLNKFKPINDEYGHDAGDAILISVAEKLTNSVRSEDVVGRFGGDEFVVLINHLDTDENKALDKALNIANKLYNAVRISINFEGANLSVGSSIGICIFKNSDFSKDELIKRADIAMYQAKKENKQIALYEKQ